LTTDIAAEGGKQPWACGVLEENDTSAKLKEMKNQQMARRALDSAGFRHYRFHKLQQLAGKMKSFNAAKLEKRVREAYANLGPEKQEVRIFFLSCTSCISAQIPLLKKRGGKPTNPNQRTQVRANALFLSLTS